jgi:hypothetical protein
MLVTLLHFGCNWWARFGPDPADPHRYTRHAAYYNSTGIRCGNKVRRHWIVPGLVRFNGTGDFNPHLPFRSLGQTFMASEVDFLFGGNRLLLKRKIDIKTPESATPDWYLIVLSQTLHGRFNFSDSGWKSPEVTVIAASQLRQFQEAMLLMKPGHWVRSACGFWQLRLSSSANSGAGLTLAEGQLPPA